MANRILVCSPGKVYSEIGEQEAAEKYTQMAIEGFDGLVKFHSDYEELKEIPDNSSVVARKDGRGLIRTLFHNQPVVRVGEIPVNLSSSSHLFNVEHILGEDLYLPDLDVVEFRGRRKEVQVASDIVSHFYREFGWNVLSLVNSGFPTEEVDVKSGRADLGEKIRVYQPEQMRRHAQIKSVYDYNKLAFRRRA
ncbi:hypothetical protein HOD88_01970 [archaeon]|jgi:hypothetical protein|nr:hypothetical protein [archaeon]